VGGLVTLWALKTLDGGVFTYGGAIIVHDNRAELEFLFPHRDTVDVTESVLPKIPLANHPQMAGTRWPLHREDWR
jgi:hypothetical protein